MSNITTKLSASGMSPRTLGDYIFVVTAALILLIYTVAGVAGYRQLGFPIVAVVSLMAIGIIAYLIFTYLQIRATGAGTRMLITAYIFLLLILLPGFFNELFTSRMYGNMLKTEVIEKLGDVTQLRIDSVATFNRKKGINDKVSVLLTTLEEQVKNGGEQGCGGRCEVILRSIEGELGRPIGRIETSSLLNASIAGKYREMIFGKDEIELLSAFDKDIDLIERDAAKATGVLSETTAVSYNTNSFVVTDTLNTLRTMVDKYKSYAAAVKRLTGGEIDGAGEKAISVESERIGYLDYSIVWIYRHPYFVDVWISLLSLVLLGSAPFFLMPNIDEINSLFGSYGEILVAYFYARDKPKIKIKDVPATPDALVKACVENNCVLFAGAGLSAQSGFAVWEEFVVRLCRWANENQLITDDELKSYIRETRSRDSNSVIDSIVSRAREKNENEKLELYLQELFSRSARPSNAHRMLCEIGFSAALTTNFDNLLEKTFSVEPKNVYSYKKSRVLSRLLKSKEFFILKLYGSPQKGESPLIAPIQLEEELQYNRTFSRTIETVFNSRTIFFVGASLEGIDGFLRAISLPVLVRQQHFALINVAGEEWTAKAELLKRRYGINVVPFNTDGDFLEMNVFIEDLRNQIVKNRKEYRSEPDEALAKKEIPFIKKLVLNDIGPFKHLELDLEKNWNIILGDNGVGKSSILKALAVALCGDRAQPYVKKLVRSGCRAASIELSTSAGTNYITKIILNPENGDPVVETDTLLPLETEGWLSIGFPALRPIGSGAKGPVLGPLADPSPRVEDLVPLITGQPDYRLDSLKEWIVTQDYRQTKGRKTESQQIKKMFETINVITDPQKVRYLGVDIETEEVMVETEKDGRISIDSVSQGMASLVGWLGALIRRMYDLHGDTEKPLHNFAIVLLDEIDAHMHPRWQRTLQSQLKVIFPNIQFIVTTHSPLVVSGLEPANLTRFYRDEERDIRQVRVTSEMMTGRADQVLTSDLFGLENTLPLRVEQLLKDYTDLIIQEDLDDGQKETLQLLSQELSLKLLSPQQRQEAREAEQIIQEFYLQKLKGRPDKEKEQIIREIKIQLSEISSQSGGPNEKDQV